MHRELSKQVISNVHIDSQKKFYYRQVSGVDSFIYYFHYCVAIQSTKYWNKYRYWQLTI